VCVCVRACLRARVCVCVDRTIVIINVRFRYRLAPEHKYPTPLNDCITATRFTLANAKRFDIDATRVAVGGKLSIIVFVVSFILMFTVLTLAIKIA